MTNVLAARTDAEARARALDIQASFIVEAPAGSGKTALLVQRYLKLLLDPNLERPEEVLAITFTNKATVELLERILQQLQDAADEKVIPPGNEYLRLTREFATAVLARDTLLHWHLLDNPNERLNVRSIDSVCAAISNSVPVLSGSGGKRDLLQQAQPLYEAAAKRTFLQLGGDDFALHSALRDVLLHRDASLQDAEALLASMLANREQWGELVPLGEDELTDEFLDTVVRGRLEKTLEDIVCSGLSRALRLMPASALQELAGYAGRWSSYSGYKGQANPLAICATLNGSPTHKAEMLEHWRALVALVLKNDGEWRLSAQSFQSRYLLFESAKGETAGLQQLVKEIESEQLKEALAAIRELPPAKYPDDQWTVAKSLFHVLHRALLELQLLFAERSQCDFAELSLSARAALRSDPTIANGALTAGGQLRHLLVDEMQDTSTAQYELLFLLTRNWDSHTETLFLVGDPKQSIYAFRKAEVARFLRTMREGCLGELQLEPLRLLSNFRSQAQLIEGFNDTFDRLFPSPSDDILQTGTSFDVPFVEAAAVRPATIPDAFHWHCTILERNADGTRKPISEYRSAESAKIREIIASWYQRPLPPDRPRNEYGIPAPWRIAVLASTRKQLTVIAASLKQAAIPYRAVEVEALGERQEILDCLALTRALLHPADRIAWLSILHGPWCGLGLVDLLTLTGEGPGSDPKATLSELVPSRAHLLPTESQSLLARAWSVLDQAASTVGRTAVSTHVERTWHSLGGDAPLTQQELSNVQRFFALLREEESRNTGRIDIRTLTSRLTDLYANPGGTDDDVQLMTIHKAKGLEWDVVLIPGLEKKGAANSSELLNWIEFESNETSQILLAPIASKGESATSIYKWLNDLRSQRDAAEKKRVFYVACTRAREELHLFAALGTKSDGTLSKPSDGTLLKACLPAAQPAFVSALSNTAPLTTQLRSALESFDGFAAGLTAEPIHQGIALAASSENPRPPQLQRLPLEFNPRARFQQSASLPYTPATAIIQSPAFERPDGSFGARAFGNVVHRFLELVARRLSAGTTPDALAEDVATWQPRLAASLRGEGLPPILAERESARVLAALTRTLSDPIGRWILAPHISAASESSLTTPEGTLRADRTFLAGTTELSTGDSALWIIDFKTTEQGARSDDSFREIELNKYRAQMETYAAIRRSADPNLTLRLGLYYPLASKLLVW